MFHNFHAYVAIVPSRGSISWTCTQQGICFERRGIILCNKISVLRLSIWQVWDLSRSQIRITWFGSDFFSREQTITTIIFEVFWFCVFSMPRYFVGTLSDFSYNNSTSENVGTRLDFSWNENISSSNLFEQNLNCQIVILVHTKSRLMNTHNSWLIKWPQNVLQSWANKFFCIFRFFVDFYSLLFGDCIPNEQNETDLSLFSRSIDVTNWEKTKQRIKRSLDLKYFDKEKEILNISN